MTDEELLKAGERLYNSFVQSPFSFLELAGLAAARERSMPWSQLGPRLKFAVLRLVVGPEPEGSVTATGETPPASVPPAAPATTTPSAPAADPAAVTTTSQDPTSSTASVDASAAPTPAASTADITQPSVSPDPADSGEEAGDRGDDHV